MNTLQEERGKTVYVWQRKGIIGKKHCILNSGGGVCVYSTFTKLSTGGGITGYGNDTTTGNKVVLNGVVQSNCGHAVYVHYYRSPVKKLEKTVPANKALDSRIDGAAGGWTE